MCQTFAKSAQILLVMSDRTDKFHELCISECDLNLFYFGPMLVREAMFVFKFFYFLNKYNMGIDTSTVKLILRGRPWDQEKVAL